MSRTNGSSILQDVKLFQPDIILLDTNIGISDKGTLINLLKTGQDTKRIPVILSVPSVELLPIASKWQANAYVEKPFDLRDLLQIVDKLLR